MNLENVILLLQWLRYLVKYTLVISQMPVLPLLAPASRPGKLALATAIGFALVGLSTAPALADTPQERVSVSESEVESSMSTEHSAIRVVQLVSDFEHPWAVAWFPEGRKLISDVRQGPDGYLYILTDESDGGLYRIEPAS